MQTVRWEEEGPIALVTFDRPERKNPLTFEAYEALHARFVALRERTHIRAVILRGAGGNFCSGGDVHEIIGPLTRATPARIQEFAALTCSVVEAMRACPQPIVAAVDGVCMGAGAILAAASDLRYGTERARIAFLFVRVGLSGADMGACAILPRIVGLGRAAELLFTGREIDGRTAFAWGFLNDLVDPAQLDDRVRAVASTIARGPSLAHATTKRMLYDEWTMSLEEALAAEALTQAACMQTNDFRRAYEAFVERRAPVFEGD